MHAAKPFGLGCPRTKPVHQRIDICEHRFGVPAASEGRLRSAVDMQRAPRVESRALLIRPAQEYVLCSHGLPTV